MTPRERVLAAIERKPVDRLPIKHQAVKEVDEMLLRHFSLQNKEQLLELFGDDLRNIYPDYTGPDVSMSEDPEHGPIAIAVWNALKSHSKPNSPLAEIETLEELRALAKVPLDCYDYSRLKERCIAQKTYARVFGYCELDIINGMSSLRGIEQTLIDIALRDPIFIELMEEKYRFIYHHIEHALAAADGEIDIVHFGEDLGSQRGLLIGPDAFDELFADKFKDIFALVHQYGAKTMMHCCGSVRALIPRLAEIGLDVLDVVQTFAEGMEIEGLHRDFGDIIAFSGTMCVQKVLPFGSRQEVQDEVKKRERLFKDGGLIIGPSHLLQPDTPIGNILEMYRTAGGYNDNAQ